MMTSKATLIGFIAVLLWSLLALLTVWSAPTPPLLLNTLCFLIGGSIGIVWALVNGTFGSLARVPFKVYVFGTLGLFGYHAMYFAALRLAPAAEAGLIAYLWPLLIVFMSGLLPGEKLTRGVIIGAFLGFAGAAVVIADGGEGTFSSTHLLGYGLAFLCALTWSGYSVLSRFVGHAPTASVAVFCLASAVLSCGLHLLFEQPQFPTAWTGWAAIVGLGVGPVGLAFYVWDIGVKKGNIQMLGVASYAAPLFSTLILVGAGIAEPGWQLALATLLIAGGAVIASRAS